MKCWVDFCLYMPAPYFLLPLVGNSKDCMPCFNPAKPGCVLMPLFAFPKLVLNAQICVFFSQSQSRSGILWIFTTHSKILPQHPWGHALGPSSGVVECVWGLTEFWGCLWASWGDLQVRYPQPLMSGPSKIMDAVLSSTPHPTVLQRLCILDEARRIWVYLPVSCTVHSANQSLTYSHFPS